MPEEDFPKMWVSSLIICCRQNCEVTESILEPLNVVLLCLYQFEDSVLKSARTNVRNGFWLLFYLMRVANCLQIIQRNLKIGLVIDIKKWNYMISHRLKFPKLSILVDNEHQLIPKLVNFYNIRKHRLLLLDAWSVLNKLYPVTVRFSSSSAVVESRYVSDIQTKSKLWSEI